MLDDIHSWTMAFQVSPCAAVFGHGPYRELSEARFVLSSNSSEGEGLPDLESTKQALALQQQCKDFGLSTSSMPCTAESRAVTQFGATVDRALAYGLELEDYINQREAGPINIYERRAVTPDVVKDWHSTLMHGLVYNAGTVRSGYAYTVLPGGGRVTMLIRSSSPACGRQLVTTTMPRSMSWPKNAST